MAMRLGDLLDDEMMARGITDSKDLILSADDCKCCGSEVELVETRDEEWKERGWIFTIECAGATCSRCACGIHPQEAVLRWNAWQRRSVPNVKAQGRAACGASRWSEGLA